MPAIAALAIGLIFGAACGYLIVLGSVLGSRDALTYILVPLAGALFGAPFGIVTFPAAYYTALSHVPIRRTILGLGYATIAAGWLGSIIAVPRPGDPTWLFLLKIYGPAAVGLAAGASYIRGLREYWWLTPKTRNVLIAVAAAALIASFLAGVLRHPH